MKFDYNQQYDKYPLMKEVNHRRFYTCKARMKNLLLKLKKKSGQLDDWCDQSVLHYIFVLGLAGLALLAGLGLYAHLSLL